MRLIDADELKKALSNKDLIKWTHEYGDAIPCDWITPIIDNAPTVNLEKTSFMKGYNYGCDDGKRFYDRPKGKWGKNGECPFCSYIRNWEDDNFCGNCGADMRKGGAE